MNTTAELAKKEFDTPNNNSKRANDIFVENTRKQHPQPQQSQSLEEKNREKTDYYITSAHSRRNPDLLTAFGSLKGNSYFRKTIST